MLLIRPPMRAPLAVPAKVPATAMSSSATLCDVATARMARITGVAPAVTKPTMKGHRRGAASAAAGCRLSAWSTPLTIAKKAAALTMANEVLKRRNQKAQSSCLRRAASAWTAAWVAAS